jgi:phosphate transport system substrate-binding protein
MKRYLVIELFAVSLLICLLAGSAGAKVIVKGSEVSVFFGKAIAEQYMIEKSEASVDVSGGGQDNAILLLAAGSCDIANSAIALEEQDNEDVKKAITDAAAKGHPIKEIPVAIDCVDFFVHKDNPVKSLTLDQLRGVYKGIYTNWSQLGGDDRPITVYHSGYGAVDHKSLSIEKWFLSFSEFTPDAVQIDKKDIFATVAGDPSGVGYDGVYFTSDSLAISGDVISSLSLIGPDGAGAKGDEPSRKYPVSRYLHMYIREGDISAEAQDFLEYMLQPAAQKIIGAFVLPLLPPARTFEFVIMPKGKPGLEQKVSFPENVSSSRSFKIDLDSETEYIAYARNNTLHDGTYPTLKAANGTLKSIVNNGLCIVNRKTDPKTYDGLLKCNVTELIIRDVAPGDVMSFVFNGQKIDIALGSASSGGIGGCNVLTYAAVVLFLVLIAFRFVGRQCHQSIE